MFDRTRRRKIDWFSHLVDWSIETILGKDDYDDVDDDDVVVDQEDVFVLNTVNILLDAIWERIVDVLLH